MLMGWHIITGAIFTTLVGLVAPTMPTTYLIIIFLSSILVDADHYLNAIVRTKNISLLKAIQYHKNIFKQEADEKRKGTFKKDDLHFFHTIEFQLFIGLLSLFWSPLLYVFIGLIFHSLADICWLLYLGRFYNREFFLSSWLTNKF